MRRISRWNFTKGRIHLTVAHSRESKAVQISLNKKLMKSESRKHSGNIKLQQKLAPRQVAAEGFLITTPFY